MVSDLNLLVKARWVEEYSPTLEIRVGEHDLLSCLLLPHWKIQSEVFVDGCGFSWWYLSHHHDIAHPFIFGDRVVEIEWFDRGEDIEKKNPFRFLNLLWIIQFVKFFLQRFCLGFEFCPLLLSGILLSDETLQAESLVVHFFVDFF